MHTGGKQAADSHEHQAGELVWSAARQHKSLYSREKGAEDQKSAKEENRDAEEYHQFHYNRI
jgi:hypothetical protein